MIRPALLAVGSLLCAFVAANDIVVSMRAPWAQTSLIAESLWVLQDQMNITDLMEAFGKQKAAADGPITSKSEYDALMAVVQKVPLATRQLLQLSLSVREKSPLVELVNGLVHDIAKAMQPPTDCISVRTPILSVARAAGGGHAVVRAYTSPTALYHTTEPAALFRSHAATAFLASSFDRPVGVEPSGEACPLPDVGGEPNAITVALYLPTAALLSPSATASNKGKDPTEWMRAIEAIAAACPTVSVVVRPFGSAHDPSRPLLVGGYGAELQLRNVEYKAHDDSASNVTVGDGGSGGGGVASAAAVAELARESETSREFGSGGLDLEVLARSFPSAADALREFARVSAAESAASKVGLDDASMKVWVIESLGVQAASRVLDATDPLAVLRAVGGNFPRLFGAISETLRTTDAYQRREQALTRNTESLVVNGCVNDGGMAGPLVVNGRTYPLKSLSSFELAEAVRNEARIAAELIACGVGERDAAVVASAPLQLPKDEGSSGGAEVFVSEYRFKIKVGGGNVAFVNNPEEEPVYTQRFAGTVQAILQTDMFGRRQFAAKNLYTSVIFMDPSSRRELSVLNILRQVVSIPVRVGFAFLCPTVMSDIEQRLRQQAAGETVSLDAENILQEHTPATSIAAIYLHIHTTNSARMAMEVLMTAADQMKAGESVLTVEHVKLAWVELMQGQSVNSDLKKALTSTKLKKRLVDAMRYFAGRGFSTTPAGLLNGLYFTSPDGLDDVFLTAFRHEQRTLPHLVQEGVLTDSVRNLHRAILDHHSASQMFSASVFAKAPTYHRVSVSQLARLHRSAAPAITPVAENYKSAQNVLQRRHDIVSGSFNITKAIMFDRPLPVDVPVVIVGDVSEARVAASAANALRSVAESRIRVVNRVDDEESGSANMVASARVVATRPSKVATALVATLSVSDDDDDAATEAVLAEIDVNVVAEVGGVKPVGISVSRRALALAIDLLDSVAAKGAAAAVGATNALSPSAIKVAEEAVKAQVAAVGAMSRGMAAAMANGAAVVGGRVVVISSAPLQTHDVQLLCQDELQRRVKPLLTAAGKTESAHVLLVSSTARMSVLSQLAVDALSNGPRALHGVPPKVEGVTDSGFGFTGLSGSVPDRLVQRCRELLGEDAVTQRCLVDADPLPPASVTEPVYGAPARVAQLGLALDIRAVVNPVDITAAKAATMLDMLRTLLPASSFSVHLNPAAKLSEMPTRSFFRYVMPAGLSFTPNGDVSGPMAVFTGVPPDDIVTVQVPDHVPDAWVVAAAASLPDVCLDNVVLRNVPPTADAQRVLGASPDRHVLLAQYEIDALVLSGTCIDGTRGTPVGGLPLVLVPGSPLPSLPWRDAVREGAREDYAVAASVAPAGEDESVHETVVIGSRYYWQLQAPRPGRYAIRVAPNSRAERIFVLGMEESGSRLDSTILPADTPPAEVPVVVASFSGAPSLSLSALRRSGLEETPLHLPPPPLDTANVGKALKPAVQSDANSDLPPPAWLGSGVTADDGDAPDDVEESGGWWRKVFDSSLDSATAASTRQFIANSADDSTLNIFSVATGRLYERFMQVMIHTVMLTVNTTYGQPTIDPVASMKATEEAGGELRLVFKDPPVSPHNVTIAEKPPRVRFWLLSNFMSGSFRRFLRVFSKMWGFDVECVTYKWPEWLRAQTVRQRQIWAYKILFLDTLFPPSLKRILYVDSDLVVRSDLHELYHRDMGVAPYAFTPFCDSRTETEGFRFWKGGSWGQLLQGRPYHISALYLVDLQRFRRTMTGDSLRFEYHRLSADPNNLANLDQDLPNYLQQDIPIHSLPLEWLWCETWCSDGDLTQAKVIDMCNNPLTKVPKQLEAAKRVEPRWTEWDELLRTVEADVDKQLGRLTPTALD